LYILEGSTHFGMKIAFLLTPYELLNVIRLIFDPHFFRCDLEILMIDLENHHLWCFYH